MVMPKNSDQETKDWMLGLAETHISPDGESLRAARQEISLKLEHRDVQLDTGFTYRADKARGMKIARRVVWQRMIDCVPRLPNYNILTNFFDASTFSQQNSP